MQQEIIRSRCLEYPADSRLRAQIGVNRNNGQLLIPTEVRGGSWYTTAPDRVDIYPARQGIVGTYALEVLSHTKRTGEIMRPDILTYKRLLVFELKPNGGVTYGYQEINTEVNGKPYMPSEMDGVEYQLTRGMSSLDHQESGLGGQVSVEQDGSSVFRFFAIYNPRYGKVSAIDYKPESPYPHFGY